MRRCSGSISRAHSAMITTWLESSGLTTDPPSWPKSSTADSTTLPFSNFTLVGLSVARSAPSCVRRRSRVAGSTSTQCSDRLPQTPSSFGRRSRTVTATFTLATSPPRLARVVTKRRSPPRWSDSLARESTLWKISPRSTRPTATSTTWAQSPRSGPRNTSTVSLSPRVVGRPLSASRPSSLACTAASCTLARARVRLRLPTARATSSTPSRASRPRRPWRSTPSRPPTANSPKPASRSTFTTRGSLTRALPSSLPR
mmetsp:Transcript_57820/g.159590  ORF Transcript_57820/g.159590 Transcript_57820/m.159590 type:complete len:257 (+) Transcript_57820:1102-1872(+)